MLPVAAFGPAAEALDLKANLLREDGSGMARGQQVQPGQARSADPCLRGYGPGSGRSLHRVNGVKVETLTDFVDGLGVRAGVLLASICGVEQSGSSLGS